MYSLSTTQEGEIHDRPSFSDETSRLLGAGTQTSHTYNASPPSPDDDDGDDNAGASPADNDGWDGYKEFEHLPWYYRPSVWLEPTPSNAHLFFLEGPVQLTRLGLLGLLAHPAICSLHSGLRWFNSAKAQPVR